jgi:hypothetical protein
MTRLRLIIKFEEMTNDIAECPRGSPKTTLGDCTRDQSEELIAKYLSFIVKSREKTTKRSSVWI